MPETGPQKPKAGDSLAAAQSAEAGRQTPDPETRPPKDPMPETAETPTGVWALKTVPRRMYDWVLHWADTPHALVALALLSLAEASFFPIPPDVLLIAMCLGLPRKAFRYAAVCSVASVIGGLLGYLIGAGVWSQVDHFFYQWVPGFSPERFGQVQALYNEYGILIVFTAGFTPIPYKIFTITSGVMGLPLLPFLLASLVGRAGRFYLVSLLIWRFGEPVRDFIDRYFNWLALAFTVLLIGGFAVLKVAF